MPPASPRHPVVEAVRRFVEAEVRPVATELEHADRYPHALVARMRELGLFGALVPREFAGLGLDVTTYARVIEELCRGFMSLAGVLNSHTMAALIVLHHGTDAQRRRFLPRFARGEARGGLCLTEPHAGSDVQAIHTVARRHGDAYVITGTKMFVTNGREGNTFALLAVTDPAAAPRHRGMSCFIVEKGHAGLRVAKSLAKLGYKGVDTAELVFEEFPVPAANLVGEVEGRGFHQVMSGLETGRINIAARAVGVAQAAFEEAVAGTRSGRGARRAPSPILADMATRLRAARLLTEWAAGMKDRGARCDLEASMAKLYASEAAQANALDALRLHGPAGTLAPGAIERHYRDTPLMLIGEGTNEIQALLIARQVLERWGERAGALTAREDEPGERRQMVLTVRQLVEKEVLPVAAEGERAGRYPAEIVKALADLGVLGALVPPEYGGLSLDLGTYAMLLEECARGWATVAALVSAHVAAADAIARGGTAAQRERWLPAMTRGDALGCPAFGPGLRARHDGRDWVLTGTLPHVEHAPEARLLVVSARVDRARRLGLLVDRGAEGVTVGPAVDTLGARGLGVAAVGFADVRVGAEAVLNEPASGPTPAARALALLRLGVAATAVGLAQAAFEAALRYAQQRSAFGKPICQHQAIQLKLADMAVRVATARLLTYRAAEAELDEGLVGMAKLHASEQAYAVALEAMRIHGGYGYTAEFPVERYYRDAARLLVTPWDNERERRDLARRLGSSGVE